MERKSIECVCIVLKNYSMTLVFLAAGTLVLGVALFMQPSPAALAWDTIDATGPQVAALRLELSGPPIPGTTVEIRGFVMADLYPLGKLDYLFSLPPGFVSRDSLGGSLENLPVWDWREIRVRARVPEIPFLDGGEIYFIVDAPVDHDRIREWIKSRRIEGEQIDGGLEDRVGELEDTLRVADYLNPWWSGWECYAGTPPYHAIVIADQGGPGPVMVLDDPGTLEAATSGMLQEEEADISRRLAELKGEDRLKEKAVARELAAVRYRLAVAGAVLVLDESAGETFFQVVSKTLRKVERIVEKLPPSVTVPDRALRQMMAITSAALVLSGGGKAFKRASRAVEILEETVVELGKSMYNGRPEGWLKRYALYNLGLALQMLGRTPEAALRFQDAADSGPGFMAPLKAISGLPGRKVGKAGSKETE